MKEISKRTFIVVILLSCKVMVEIISSLKVADLEKEKMFSSTNEELNYPPYVASQRDVENWSLQGLSKRATMVRAQFIDEGNNTWTLKEVCVLNDDCRSIDPIMNHIIMTPYDITYCNTEFTHCIRLILAQNIFFSSLFSILRIFHVWQTEVLRQKHPKLLLGSSYGEARVNYVVIRMAQFNILIVSERRIVIVIIIPIIALFLIIVIISLP